MQRRQLIKAAAVALAAPAARFSHADTFPSHPITLTVPYAVGGNADLTARLFADAFGKSIGQSVIVENRGGGGGAIGAMYVINQRPDGHALLFSAPSVFSVTPHLVKVGYSLSNIKPVCLVSKTPTVLVARKGSRYKSLDDLVKASKASPGSVAMGYSGLGTPNHLALLDLEALTKARFNGIAYRGSGPMLQDMMAGQIEVAPDQISTSKPYIDSGELIPLAVFGEPLAMLPGVPSVSSLGKEAFDATTYLGLAAPAGTPDEVIAALQKAARPALEDTRFADGMKKFSSSVYWGSSQDYESKMKAEDRFIQEMVASGNIKPE